MSSKKLMKRLFSCALALLGVLLAATTPVSAQQTGSSIIDELDAAKVDLVDVDLMLNDITHEVYEVMVQVNHARNLIVQSGSMRLLELAIEDAQEFVGLITSGKFAELEGLLGHLNTEVLGALIARITTLIDDVDQNPDLTPRDLAFLWKLKGKAESIELYVGEIMNEVEVLNTRLDNPEGGTGDPVADCEEQNTIKACLDAALEELGGDTPDLTTVRGYLEQAYQNIRRAIREANRIVRKKKLIIMRLTSMYGICSRLAGAYCEQTLSSESNSINVRPAELKAASTAQIDVYSLTGRLVAANVRASNGLESVKAQLANGVYMAIVRHFNAEGKLIKQDVQRLVVLH